MGIAFLTALTSLTTDQANTWSSVHDVLVSWYANSRVCGDMNISTANLWWAFGSQLKGSK
jgi:hypothetical protein